ncbi:MAG: hypothetical protein RL294_1135, partial [Actinomycetota bacterium]
LERQPARRADLGRVPVLVLGDARHRLFGFELSADELVLRRLRHRSHRDLVEVDVRGQFERGNNNFGHVLRRQWVRDVFVERLDPRGIPRESVQCEPFGLDHAGRNLDDTNRLTSQFEAQDSHQRRRTILGDVVAAARFVGRATGGRRDGEDVRRAVRASRVAQQRQEVRDHLLDTKNVDLEHRAPRVGVGVFDESCVGCSARNVHEGVDAGRCQFGGEGFDGLKISDVKLVDRDAGLGREGLESVEATSNGDDLETTGREQARGCGSDSAGGTGDENATR